MSGGKSFDSELCVIAFHVARKSLILYCFTSHEVG